MEETKQLNSTPPAPKQTQLSQGHSMEDSMEAPSTTTSTPTTPTPTILPQVNRSKTDHLDPNYETEQDFFNSFYYGSESIANISKEDWHQVDLDIFFPKWHANNSSGVLVGKCYGVVHTSPEQLLNWKFDTMSQYSVSEHERVNGPDKLRFPNRVLAHLNDHHKINYSCKRLPPPLSARDWLMRCVHKQIDHDKFVLLYMSIFDDDPDVPQNFQKSIIENVVRGELSTLYTFERLPHNQTKFTMVAQLNIKGSIPKSLSNRGERASLVTEVCKATNSHLLRSAQASPPRSKLCARLTITSSATKKLTSSPGNALSTISPTSLP